MATYFYAAKSKDGQEKTGRMEAQDEHQLAGLLRQEGYVLILAEKEADARKKGFNFSLPFLNRVSLKEKLFFTRNLTVMISAGISLPKALRTLADITKNKKLKNVLFEIIEEVNRGKSFSATLAKYPAIFPEIFSSLVRAGEESGTMEESLKNLAQQMERQHELKTKVTGAMMYPAVIIVAVLAIGALMLVMVIPKLSEVFIDLGVELPLSTRMVIFSGNFMSQRWYLVLLGIFFLVAAVKFAMGTKRGKRIMDKFFLKIPIISSIIQKTNSAYTTRTISSLISSGVPIVRSLEVTSGVLGNVYFKEALTDAAEKVRKGDKLSDALKIYSSIYPQVVIQMVEVGEETGETADILKKLADFFEEEVSSSTKNLSSIIEPILMLFIGVMVGFFAISMLQPMYSVMGSI